MISEHLEQVADKAITALENILDVPLPEPEHETFAVIAKAHNAAGGTILGTQTKVDENRLRKQGNDMMPAMIAAIHQYEKENPTRIVVIEGSKP